MVNTKKNTSLIVTSLLMMLFFFQGHATAQFSLKKVSSYAIEINDDFLLPQLLKGVMDRSGEFYYCDLTTVLKFDNKGVFINKIAPIGRGPTEFETLIDCNVTDSYLVVFPFNEFRVLFFNKSDLTFSHEFSLESNRSRRFTTIDDSLFITFNDVSYQESSKVLSLYDIEDGYFINSHIDNPEMAYVGNTSNGGGVISTNGEIFYSFISYPGIWKYEIETGSIEYFDEKPDYFKSSEVHELEDLKIPNDHRYYRGYMFSKSRSEGIFLLGEDKIVQMIATGNPWESGRFDSSKIRYFLEIWDTNGNKLASKIPTPENSKIAFIKGSSIYFSNKTAFSEESDKLKKGENLELFSVYELIANKN
tara:strand:- start:14808 stop:15893 length:1086 start_codon:yes stop_codon:yes gene_type:complete